MPSSLTFSGWNWLWPVVVFGALVVLVLFWTYRASAGQPLRWVTVAECRQLELLEADWPIVERLAALSLEATRDAQQIASSKRTS